MLTHLLYLRLIKFVYHHILHGTNKIKAKKENLLFQRAGKKGISQSHDEVALLSKKI